MQWSLFLLLLMGPCSFFACRNYDYHFINQAMTWSEAQAFCKENHTDLAMVYDKADVERLHKSTDAQGEAWIGLHSKEGMMWHWSLPGKEYDEIKWRPGCPDEKRQLCGIRENGKWRAVSCEKACRFICYKENTQSGESQYHLIEETMTWPKAQNFCRENYTDLISGVSQCNDSKLRDEIDSKNKSCHQCWFIGLFRDNWKWSSGSRFSFRYWDTDHTHTEPNEEKCAVTVLNEGGRWKKAECDVKKPFFCYDDKMILIKQEKTWEEALDFCRNNSMDLVSITDPHQQELVKKKAKNAMTHYVWLGLRYSCVLDMWFWVNDQRVCYENWGANRKYEECSMAGTIVRDELIWESRQINTKFNFICAV